MFSITLASLLLFSASTTLAKDLVPIHPNSLTSTTNSKRASTPSDLNLKSSETFLWADPNAQDAALANLTVYMPGSTENILSMEQFNGMLTKVKCGTREVEMTFKDNATFSYAQKVWDWVNGADNHSFVMVAGPGDCGNNTNRLPFVISSLSYDQASNKATLTANQSDWQTIAHSYDLVVGQVTQGPITRRDITKSSSIDFTHSFPYSIGISQGKLSATLACTNCSTAGTFDLSFKISQKLGIPTGASMTLKPKDVSAIAQIKLSGSGSLTDALSKEFEIISIPVDGVKIPAVLELGPFLTFSVGAELSALKRTAGVQGGAKACLSNDAVLTMDLLDPSKNTFSGWEPQIDTVDVKVDASISGGVAVYLKPAVELKAEALGHGFAVGLNMKVPNLSAQLAAITSPQGACAAPERKTLAGVKASLNIGASLNIQAKKESGGDPLFTVTIAHLDKTLAQKCFPFGDDLKNVTSRTVGSPAAAGAFVREIAGM